MEKEREKVMIDEEVIIIISTFTNRGLRSNFFQMAYYQTRQISLVKLCLLNLFPAVTRNELSCFSKEQISQDIVLLFCNYVIKLCGCLETDDLWAICDKNNCSTQISKSKAWTLCFGLKM